MMIQNDAKCVSSVGVWNSGQILVGIKRHSTQSLSEIQFLCRVQYNQKMQMLVYASLKTIRLDSTSHNPRKNMLLALIIATDIYMHSTYNFFAICGERLVLQYTKTKPHLPSRQGENRIHACYSIIYVSLNLSSQVQNCSHVH